MNDRYKNFSIELDCAPGTPRPGDLIGGVLEGTGLEVVDFETSAPFFGHQTWVLRESAMKDELFMSLKPTLKERVTKLHDDGLIRYGSW